MPLTPKMPANSPKVTASSSGRRIAAFDFDGTLTWTDSFTAFLRNQCGDARIAAVLASRPSILLDYLKTKDRGALKSRLIYNLLGPISQEDLETRIQGYVTKTGHALFRPDALKTWAMHDRPDQLRVIVTASPDILVRPFGHLIGADRVIGTRLGFSADGQLRPDLDGINCRGAEKVRRIREAFGEDVVIDSAYGDTKGDREMIAAAQSGFYRVFKVKPRPKA